MAKAVKLELLLYNEKVEEEQTKEFGFGKVILNNPEEEINFVVQINLKIHRLITPTSFGFQQTKRIFSHFYHLNQALSGISWKNYQQMK